MRHICFLLRGHKYCLIKMDKYFDNGDESKSTAPSGTSVGKRVFLIVSKVTFVFGKKTKMKTKERMSSHQKGTHSRRC